MKKLALLIPDLRGGGSERMVSRLSYMLSDVYDLTIILFDEKNQKYPVGCDVICLACPAKKGLLHKMKNVFLRRSRIQKLCIEKDFDMVISFTRTGNLSLGISNINAVKVISCRNYYDYKQHSRLYRFLLKHSDYLLCNSQEMFNDIKINIGDIQKLEVLQNCFDINEIVKQSHLPMNKEMRDFYFDHQVIVNMGRFIKGKGHDSLIRAFDIIKESCPRAKLLLIGEGGAKEKEIFKMITQSDYSKDIKVIPFQKNPFIYIHYAAVYAFSSSIEGFPNSLVEAMACETAIVASECKTGVKEILCDNDEIYGLLCPRLSLEFGESVSELETVQIYADAVVKVLLDSELQQDLAKKAYERAKHFSDARMKKIYVTKLDKMMEVKKC